MANVSTNPAIPIVQARAIKWKPVLETIAVVFLALTLATLIVVLMLAISANKIEVG